MVGVAGRSKACATCKSRHVRCDEGRPTCQRCEKGGFHCRGYDRPVVFIDSTPTSAKSGATRPPKSATGSRRPSPGEVTQYTTTSLAQSSENSLTSILLTSSRQRLLFCSNATPAQATASHESAASPESNSPPCHLSQHAHDFIRNLLLVQGVRQALGDSPQEASGPSSSPILNISVEAVALLLHGRLTQQALSVDQATKLFGMALGQLRGELGMSNIALSSSKKIDAPLLSVVMNMALYEWVAYTTRDAWKAHVQGLAALVHLCGPGAFRSKAMRQAFEQARAHIMVLHMDESRKTFLEEPCWQTVPWSDDPSQKSLTSHYIDIVCCIPGILEDENQLEEMQRALMSGAVSADPPPQETLQLQKAMSELYTDIRTRAIHLYTKLLDLRWTWELQHPKCCWEVPVPFRTVAGSQRIAPDNVHLSIDNSTGRPVFDTVLYFSALPRAVETNLYYSSSLVLRSLARSLNFLPELINVESGQPDSGPLPFSQRDRQGRTCAGQDPGLVSPTTRRFSKKLNPALLFPGESASDRYAVRDICRTVEFMLQSKYRPAGGYFLMYPLRLAQMFNDIYLPPEKDDPVGKPGSSQSGSGNNAGWDADVSNLSIHDAEVEHENTPPGVPSGSGPNGGDPPRDNGQRAVLSDWIKRMMRYIGDVHGFGVTYAYA